MKNEFNEVTLKDISLIKGRIGWKGLKSREYTKNGYPILTSYNLVNVFDGIDYTIKINRVPKWRYEESPDIKIQNGDILMSKITGKVGYVNNLPEKSTVNSTITIIRITENSKVLNKFIYYFLKSNSFKKFFIQNTKGTTMSSVNHSSLKKIKIILPPIKSQIKTVSILEKIDKIKQMRNESDELTKEYLNSVFLEMFGKYENTDILDKHLLFLTSGSRGWAKYYSEKGDLFLRIENVERNQLNVDNVVYVNPPNSAESKRTEVKTGDVLLSITADLGRTCVIPEKFPRAFINQHLAILRFDSQLNPVFVAQYIVSIRGMIQINKMNKGVTKAGLNFQDIRSISIPIPPIKVQEKFANISQQIKQLKQYQVQSNEHIGNLFNNLLQQDFRGELAC